jgi:hypothetical protein
MNIETIILIARSLGENREVFKTGLNQALFKTDSGRDKGTLLALVTPLG